MSMNVDIVLATPADLPAVVSIYNEAIEERIATSDLQPQTLAERMEAFERLKDRYPFLVAKLGNEIVGYAHAYPLSPREGYRLAVENAVYVRRDRRGTGLGRRLLGDLLASLKRGGFHYVMARIFTHNSASQALHRAAGFREVGTQREVAQMDGRWYDVAIFEKLL